VLEFLLIVRQCCWVAGSGRLCTAAFLQHQLAFVFLQFSFCTFPISFSWCDVCKGGPVLKYRSSVMDFQDIFPLFACDLHDWDWVSDMDWRAIACASRFGFRWASTVRCGYRIWADLEPDRTQEQAWFQSAERESRMAAQWFRRQKVGEQSIATGAVGGDPCATLSSGELSDTLLSADFNMLSPP